MLWHRNAWTLPFYMRQDVLSTPEICVDQLPSAKMTSGDLLTHTRLSSGAISSPTLCSNYGRVNQRSSVPATWLFMPKGYSEADTYGIDQFDVPRTARRSRGSISEVQQWTIPLKNAYSAINRRAPACCWLSAMSFLKKSLITPVWTVFCGA